MYVWKKYKSHYFKLPKVNISILKLVHILLLLLYIWNLSRSVFYILPVLISLKHYFIFKSMFK